MDRSKMALALALVGMVVVMACAPAAPPATPTPAPAAKVAAPTPAPTPTTPPKPTATPTKAPPEKVGLHHGSYSTAFTPHFAARDMGYFAEEGLDVEIRLVTAAVSVKALIAGEHEFEGNMGSSKNAIIAGAPLKAIMSFSVESAWSIMARPEIKSLKDLSGKRLGVNSRGFVGEVHASLALREVGIDPQKDIIWVPMGAGAAKLGVARAGGVDALVTTSTEQVVLQKEGFNLLVDLGPKVPAAGSGLAVTEKFLKERRETVLKAMRAEVKAMKFLATKSPQARAWFRKFVAEYFPTLTPEDADKALDHEVRLHSGLPGLGYMSEPQMLADIRVMKAELEAIGEVMPDVTPDRVYDFSLVKLANEQLKDWKP